MCAFNAASASMTASADSSPRISILIVDDDRYWHKIWLFALEGLGYHLQFATDPEEALGRINEDFSLVIANLLLRDSFSSGWLTDFTLIMDKIAARAGQAVIITGSHELDVNVMRRLLDLQQQYRHVIRNISFKDEVGTPRLRQIVEDMFPHSSRQAISAIERPTTVIRQHWLTERERTSMYAIATWALQGRAEAMHTDEQLDEVLLQIVEQIHKWFEEHVGLCDRDDVQRTWENFEEQPAVNRRSLHSMLVGSRNAKEDTLHEHTCRLRREIVQRRAGSFYDMMSGFRFTGGQVSHMCTQMALEGSGRAPDDSQQDKARWLFNYAKTNQSRQFHLVELMLEANPVALLVKAQ